jgi:nucleotide-binding universal stress UspA family protein
MAATILVPLDGSKLSERALPFASALATATGADVSLVRAALARDYPFVARDEAELMAVEEAESAIAKVTEEMRGQGLVAAGHVYYDRPADAIVDAAKRGGAAMIVMSTHGRSGIGRWVYGSVADEVLRRAECPVVLVPSESVPNWQPGNKLRILVTLDGSDLSESIVRRLDALGGPAVADLVLLRVVLLPTYPLYGDGYAYIPFDEEAERAAADEYVAAVADRLKNQGWSVESIVTVGLAADAIVQTARDQKADMIAMATHGYGGLARFVLGSVATSVLHRAPAPLMLARPTELAEVSPVGGAVSADGASGSTSWLALTSDEAAVVRTALQRLSASEDPSARPAAALLERLVNEVSATGAG